MAVGLDDAPTLDHLGILTGSMQRRARLRADPDIHGRLPQALTAASDHSDDGPDGSPLAGVPLAHRFVVQDASAQQVAHP